MYILLLESMVFLDKVSLSLINVIIDSTGEENVLHDMIGNASKTVFGKSGSAIYVMEFELLLSNLVFMLSRMNETLIRLGFP